MAHGTWTYLEDPPNTRWQLVDDDCTWKDLEDPCVFGLVEYVHERAERNPVTGELVRPDGFTGHARVLTVGYCDSDRVWWEPPADIRCDVDACDRAAEYVRDVLTWGYSTLVVERVRPSDRDAYGVPIVDASTTLGGIPPLVDYSDLGEHYLRDMLAELED